MSTQQEQQPGMSRSVRVSSKKPEAQTSPLRHSHHHQQTATRNQSPPKNHQLQPVIHHQQTNSQHHQTNSQPKNRFIQLNLQADTQAQQQPHQVFGQNHLEENSKLNKLISEYRRENERCSNRISELQRKLDMTASARS